MIKPLKLQPGDTVATITLSWGGPGTFPHRYEAGVHQFEEAFDVHVVPTRHALRDADWIARNPKSRADDLMEAFADPNVKGIISTIGGDDSIRTLPHIDLEVIRHNPKVFMGFSDTTVTHLCCHKAGLTPFYGPSIMAGFAENSGLFPYMADSVRRTLFDLNPIGVITPNTEGWTVEFLDWADPANQRRKRALQPSNGWKWLQGKGAVNGHLFGGCLEVLDWLRGTSVWPNDDFWRDAILFLETSEEAPSPTYVARTLRVFATIGILHQISGILFGRPGGQVPPSDFAKYDEAILQVVAHEQGLTELPIITRMDFGHTDLVFVLPYGAQATIDCDKQQFSIVS